MNKTEEMQNIAQLIRLEAKYMTNFGVPEDIFAYQAEAIQRSLKEGNLRGLRMAATDIVQRLDEWENPLLLAEFLAEVKETTGKSAFEIAGNPAKRLAKVLKRGIIRNEGEYYLLKEHYTEDVDETDQIEKLLETFELSLIGQSGR